MVLNPFYFLNPARCNIEQNQTEKSVHNTQKN